MKFDFNLRNLQAFIKGYGSVIDLLPKTKDEEELKKDVKNVGQDFWFVIQKEEIDFEGKQQRTST